MIAVGACCFFASSAGQLHFKGQSFIFQQERLEQERLQQSRVFLDKNSFSLCAEAVSKQL